MNDLPVMLSPSSCLPVLFVGHGSPMNVIEDNAFRRGWQALGACFGDGLAARWPWPRLILCVSAHWLTRGWWLTAMAQPATIHDFGGFPSELYQQRYPAPGAPEAAGEISQLIRQPDGSPLGLDGHEWGLDHGAWGVLLPMFPRADIPVLQLSLDVTRPAVEHFALGRQLSILRERGVLIVASGNIVHNLRALRRDVPDGQAHDWAVMFDRQVTEWIASKQLEALCNAPQLGPVAQLAHPSWEHYLPLLYAAGAARPDEDAEFFNIGFQGGSIAMRSVIWG